MSMITLNSTVVVTKTIVAGNISDDVIILEPVEELYYSLDSVGMFIWNLIQSPCLVQDICEAIIKEYAVERAACEQDVLELMEDMRVHRLLEVCDAG